MPNEQQQFLEEVEPVDILDQPLNPVAPVVTEEPEEVPEDIKNRAHKRLEAKLQSEREANIAMAARLEALSESQKVRTEGAEYLKNVERIYGTDSPEAKEATELLKDTFVKLKEEAIQDALSIFKEEQRKEQEAVRQEEARLDSMIEDIEDTLGVTISQEKQKGFFKMLEKLSPKDENGRILNYADPIATWEMYQARTEKPNPAKELSSRSMVQSSSSQPSKLEDDVNMRFLKENGII